MAKKALKTILACSVFLSAGLSATAKKTHTTETPASTVDSADMGPTPAEAPKAMEEVVVTGQYSANSTDKAVQKIRIIDRAKIDAMSAQNLRDVLSNEMNIRLAQDNVLGSSMSIQGISGQNVKILVDGVAVIGRQDGNIDISQINLHNIERIEIIEGPMSVNYGTDALAGTINLISKKTLQHKFEGSVSSYNESIGTYNLNGRLGFSQGAQTVIITGARNLFDGWNEGDKPFSDFKAKVADSSRSQSWNPKLQLQGGLQYIYRLKNTTINYKGDYFKETIINKGMPDYYGENASDDYYRTYRFDNAVFLNSTLAKDKKLNIQVAYNDFKRAKNTYAKELTTLNEELSKAAGSQDTSKFKLLSSRGTFSTTARRQINYEVGYDISVESATGIRIKDKEQQIGDYAAFASMEYKPISNLTIRPGLRYAYNTGYEAPLIPSVNVRYKLNQFTLRTSYAKGFRAPTLKELYFDFHDTNHDIDGNENLKAEFSDNVNASISYGNVYSLGNYKVEGSVFYNDIRNRIDLGLVEGTAAQYSYINIGKYKTQGIQLTGEVSVSDVKLTVGGSYIGRYNALEESAEIPALSYALESRASVMYDIKPIDMSIAVFYKNTGKTPGFGIDANGNTVRTSIDAFSIADITMSKRLFDKRLNLSAGCRNIFDVTTVNRSAASSSSGSAHSSNSPSLPYSTGRAFFIKLDVNLNSN